MATQIAPPSIKKNPATGNTAFPIIFDMDGG